MPHITINLNAKVLPLDRGEIFEDPLEERLDELGLGEVVGGGTLQADSGEVENCDIEVEVESTDGGTIGRIQEIVEELGAPIGSKIIIEDEDREIPIGVNEGLGVYINGTDLPDEVYRECDINFVYSEFNRLLDGAGAVFSHWEGGTETALYLYGPAADEMQSLVQEFLDSYPLCEKARVVKVA